MFKNLRCFLCLDLKNQRSNSFLKLSDKSLFSVDDLHMFALHTIFSSYDFLFIWFSESKHDEKVTTALNWDADEDALCCGLVCLAIVGIEDPVRAEVP